MSTGPTGRVEDHDGELRLVLERRFRAPIDDVWSAVTEPERMARWIGTWTGDPTSGRVLFAMTAEGDDVDAGVMEIRECDPPRRLAVTSHVGDERWRLELDLSEHEGVTTLVFTQPGIDPTAVENVGPGWEYYLDRLVAAQTGGDVGSVDFDRDYYPAMLEHYRDQAGSPPD
jgi:uncharacterized protein YndB with AHSA1/START domain